LRQFVVAAAGHENQAARIHPWRPVGRRAAEGFVEAILDRFLHIPGHVVKAPGIWQVAADLGRPGRMDLLGARRHHPGLVSRFAVAEIGVGAGLAEIIAPEIDRIGAGTVGVFPLGVGEQAVSMAGPGAEPCQIGFHLVAGDADGGLFAGDRKARLRVGTVGNIEVVGSVLAGIVAGVRRSFIFQRKFAGLDQPDAADAPDLCPCRLRIGPELVHRNLVAADGERIGDRHFVLRQRPFDIFHRLSFPGTRAHHELAGRQRHHFRAIGAVAERLRVGGSGRRRGRRLSKAHSSGRRASGAEKEEQNDRGEKFHCRRLHLPLPCKSDDKPSARSLYASATD
jgi:hypothetical protein